MVQRTIDQFYPTYAEAVQVVADLTAAGISPANVSLIESELDARLPQGVATDSLQNPVTAGATLGAAIGGGIGVLAGVGAITIPFADPLVVTGWVLPGVVFAIVGALIGAGVGALVGLGVKNKAGHTIVSRLQRGQQLVMVRVEESAIPLVQSIMARAHVVPAAALATTEPLYDVDVPVRARTIADEVAPVPSPDRRPPSLYR